MSQDETQTKAEDTIETPELCPLDGAATEPFDDGFRVCTRCREILKPSELVDVATPETWAAYLVAGETDTDPKDAPLARQLTNS